MTADLLADWSNVVIVDGNNAADVIRFIIAIVVTLVVALRANHYWQRHHDPAEQLNYCAAAGALGWGCCIVWAQVLAIIQPGNGLTLFNLVLLGVSIVYLFGAKTEANIHLFNGRKR